MSQMCQFHIRRSCISLMSEDIQRVAKDLAAEVEEIPRLADHLSQHRDTCFLADTDGETQGLLCWSPQGWESVMVGTSVARIDYLQVRAEDYHRRYLCAASLLEAFNDRASEEGLGMGTLRVSERDVALLHAAQTSEFRIIECLLTFERDARQNPEFKPTCRIRGYDEEDLAALRDVATKSFQYSRLHSDPLIARERADLSRAEWIQNSCRGRADEVLVAEKEGRVVGFVACKSVSGVHGDRVGVLDLIAVLPEYSGQGIGASLVEAFLAYYEGKASMVRVGTQAKNVPSVRLYEKCGFRLARSDVSFHRHFCDTREPISSGSASDQ